MVASLPSIATAQSERVTHNVAHFGISFAMETMCVPIIEKITEKKESTLICAGSTFAVGIAKEVYDRHHGETYDKNLEGITWDGLGILASALTISFGF